MDSKKVVTKVTFTCIKFTVYIIIAIAVVNLGRISYDFGYGIFGARVMAEEPGEDVTVTIRENATVYKVGETLERKGLTKSALTFWVQEKLSEYSGQIEPGSYILNTSYDVEEIMYIITQQDKRDEEGNLKSDTNNNDDESESSQGDSQEDTEDDSEITSETKNDAE